MLLLLKFSFNSNVFKLSLINTVVATHYNHCTKKGFYYIKWLVPKKRSEMWSEIFILIILQLTYVYKIIFSSFI